MTNLGGGKWKCEECNYVSKSSNVYKHIESRHVEARMYTCSVCSRVFKGINSYNVHYYTNHKN